MKTLIILILLIALAGAAGLSRPSDDDFKRFIKAKAESTHTGFFEKIGAGMWADGYIKDCTLTNKLLWTEVKKDGKTVYIGAVSHWWPTEKPSSPK